MTTPPTTNTPLTDVFETFCLGTGTPELVKKDDARQLELKNQELEAELSKLKTLSERSGCLLADYDALKLAGDELANICKHLDHCGIDDRFPASGIDLKKALTNWQSLTTTKKENEG